MMHTLKPSGKTMEALADALLGAAFAGEIDTDSALRAAMSTDNSVYQIVPDLIAAPANVNDLVLLLRIMERPDFASISITARGGGTGTNGQSLNSGVIIDFRRHMNRLLELNAAEGWADVEPGMVLDDLNERIRASGWFFAPETSTSTRCTIGGMVSTDASGKGSRIYGKTSDNVLGLEIVRAEGPLFSQDNAPAWAHAMLSSARASAEAGREAFVDNTPRLNRRFTGYDLERACPVDGGFEWWRLFLGAEGTLGLISKVRVKLRRIEPEKRLIVVGFDTFRNALSAAQPLLKAEPTAIEVMDETVQAIAEEAGILKRLPTTLRGTAAQRVAYVFIEFNGTSASLLDRRLSQCQEILSTLPGTGAIHIATQRAEIRELWGIRSAGVGLLGKVDAHARPVAFVEDTVVPPENLPAFVDEFLAVLSEYRLGFGIYGHVDVGCLHIRPALNLDLDEDRTRLVAVSDAVFELTRKYGGIFWGEHGKGVRGAYLREWVGNETYRALQGVKAAFDPAGRYNPGKLVSVDTPVMGIATTPFRTFNAADGDALTKAFRCNGNAQCLSYEASTSMCPSFKASADVRHSPKGRADALRAWHGARSDVNSAEDMSKLEADLLKVLDTCLGCKACASSCPVQVDIPAMRSAFHADYYRRHTRRLADRLVLMAERYSPLAVHLSPVISPFWPVIARVADVVMQTTDTPDRLASALPPALRLGRAALRQPLPNKSVIVVQDWFTALFDAEVQRDVAAGFQALGYEPRFLTMLPSGKAAHSAGDLGGFRRMAGSLASLLSEAVSTGKPLVSFEPAFGMMLRQEYVKAGIVVPKVMMPQEFLLAQSKAGNLPKVKKEISATLLSHCTEASAQSGSIQEWRDVFAALGIRLDTPAAGCCGMAGLFGHQKRHQSASRKLFDLSWRQHADSNSDLIATGFSCRCQMERLAGRKIRHPMGLIAKLLT